VQILARSARVVIDHARVLEDLESRPVTVEHIALTDLAIPAASRDLYGVDVCRTHDAGCCAKRALRILRGYRADAT
jgi:hypothetical protein